MIGAVVVGNLAADAETRDAGGTPVLAFRVASNSKRKVNGEWVDAVTWVSGSLFGDRGAKLAQYMTKGSTVVIRGNLELREYEKDGQKRSTLEMRVEDVQLLGGKPADAGGKSTKPETGFDVF
jgi:single-strand DNA-binding protein